MTSSTTRAFMAKKQSTSFAQVATNLLNVLQGYTKGIRFVAVLTMLLVVGIGQAWGAEETATLSFADKAQRTSFSTTKQVWEQDGVTFTNDKSSSTNNVADYAAPVRLYANSKVTVEFTSNMTKIVFDCYNASYATAMKNSIGTVSGATVSVSSDKVTVTFTSAVASFTVAKLTAQVRIDSITVSYEEAVTEYNITYTGDDHITYSGTKPETIKKEDSGFELEFSVDDGYKLNNVQVKMGGQNLVVDDDYYWEEGYLLILPETDITGDIEIIFETVATCTNPTITTQPSAATYTKGATATALKVVASGDDLTYQWYSNTSNSTSGATKINDATNSTYTPSTSTVSTKYYYCIVSSGSCSTTSNIVSVVVKNPPFTVTLVPGSGSVSSTTLTETSAGAGVTLPAPTLNGCGEWTFAGWKTTSAVTTETTTEPALIPAGNYNPSSNITLYAVYQRTEETEGGGGTENVSRSYTFSNFTAGTQYADNEVHKLDDYVTLTTTDCHFTSELRIYSSSTYNGYVVSNKLPGRIVSIGFNAGNKVDAIDVFGSTNGTDWTKVGQVSVTSTSYKEYTLNFVGTTNYTYFKLDVAGSNQVRLKSITITWESTSAGGTITTTYYHSTPDCGPSCEQLGAATGLTVETDFVHTDGKTYVKFSWTPADNTNNYAASQKLCFGKVGEAGTCVDDLEKNLTWTGDLKSRLEPGEYWWSIQALGDGVNYCDGDVVNGANFTIEAPTYTVEWFVNGEEAKGTPTTSVIAGQKVTVLPTTPTSADCDDNKVFVGWTDTEIDGTSANAPTNLYKELGDFPAINADTIYYAVFASQGGADVWQETDIANISASDEVVVTIMHGENTYALTNNQGASGPPIAEVLNIENDAIKLSPMPDEYQWNISEDEGSLIFYPNGTTATWLYCTNTNNGVRVGTNEAKTFTIDSKSGYLKNDATSRYLGVYFNNDGEAQDWRCYTNTTGNIANQTLAFYKKTSSLTNYSTTCVTPVWETGAATIDKTSFTVNCGERSPMTGANGAAKITFPTDKIYNFTSAITIEATTGFLVSTSQNVDANYQPSVSQSPLVGTTNANTFYDKFVYVRAEAPAQSDTDLEGTITIKNSKGETLQTFSVTADVTCSQYSLTLIDRGVSTEQPTKYYAGETINEAPTDPEGVCTDPIHYVFDGWAETTVAAGATTYTKVTFPYTVTGNTKFYAVYRYVVEGSGDSGDYVKVTENLDDYSGDYLFVYETGNVAFNGGLDELDETSNTIAVTINDKTIASNATTDAAKFTIAKVDGGYSIQSASGYYIGWSTADKNGLNANSKYSANYYLNTISNSIISGVKGTLKYNKTSGQERFRYYQSGQEAIALYRKAASYLYTTSPVCGPHLVVTEGKNIYVTGGNAGGTRDLVIAQQKVSYKATRLNVGPTSQVPDVKVATNGITVGGVVTSDVKVTIDQTKEQQTDGTYTITGTITVQYQPSVNDKQEDIQVQLAVDYNTDAKDNFTIHARSLPQEFVIVAKQGDKWYALNGDMNNGSSANPANGQVTLDDDANPTKATYAPCNTIYTFDGVPNTGDRTRVRFQGTDGAWLWAASGTNVGIQNKSLKDTPEGDNKAYNWKLETEDNITYKFHNDNSSRLLGLSGEKFGMYSSAVNDIRILPYDAKCLYNYAPTNLKVSVLKGSYVTLTWDAVAGATKYQYSTDATNWTDAGTEPTVTINGLSNGTNYTYCIRAYHADAGVSQECFDYSEITFTTADCDDVPTDITYTADLNSITVSWTAAAPTATIKLFMDEEGTHLASSYPGATSPKKISGGLKKNTTYYIQILADGTCASPIVPVKTEDVEVDIVEWMPDGIIVDINTDETVGVTLENEVSYGSGLGTEATELFFSKYYEASYNVKLVAIYNGTKNIIDLTDYIIKYGKTSWETNYITLKDFGATKGQIQPGEEIILYSYTENNADDKKILDCVHDAFPDGNWVEVTSSNNDGKGTLSFGGDKTIILCKTEYDDEADEYYDNIIDVIGALIEDPNEDILPTNENTEKPSWGDKEGWVCETGLSIADDSQIGISTNRCLLVRNNTVTSGLNAVAQNIEGDFVTLCSEWKGAQVPDSDIDNGVAASCENFAYVGTFDYSDYYTQYESMGEEKEFDENARNDDGTVTIPITDLYKHACSNIRVKLSNKGGEVLSDREYKVPIMITTTQGTDGQTFLDLQQNLATKEVDDEGNVINTYPLSLDEVREICKTCDVVVRDNATLTKIADDAANDHPQVRNVYVYENSSLIVPNGTNYTINNLSLRRNQDAVASVSTHPDALKLPESAAAPITLDFRLSAESWHWFTLPFDCNISEVTWVDGSPAQYNVDWFLMTYDGEKRAETQAGGCWKEYTGTTINAGDGFILAINGNINNPAHTYELRFPMSKEVLAAEGTDKTVDVRAWGVETNIRPNHKGWNLVGNPYLAYYQRNNITNFEGLRLGQLTGPDSQTGYWEQTGEVPYVVVPIGAGWEAYEQLLASETDLLPFTAYFVQVGNDGKHDSSDELSISFDHTKLQLSATPMPASIIQRSATEASEPVIVGVSLTNAKGESDKTSLVIDDQFTDKYEMNADFFKWFGDYYKYYTKPVLYTIGADDDKLAFNAISEELATQPISLGMYAAQAGDYTFTLDRRSDLSKVQEVWLHDATQDIHINLLQESYIFHTAKTESAGRFFLSVKMAPKVSTEMDNVTDGTVWATTQDHTIVVNGLLSDAQLWIYDATGKLLHTDHTMYYQHSYSVPQSGTYFVRVQNTIQTQTIKVVVE